MNKSYRLEFLPIARQDMVDIVRYISTELSDPAAAEGLSLRMIEAAEKALLFPYSYPLLYPIKPLKREYRKLPVGNYLMLYTVDEARGTVTVARVIYAKRDYGKLLD